MSSLFLIFTLCGVPQYFVLSSSEHQLDGPPSYIAGKMSLEAFKGILENDKYIKKEIKLDQVTGMYCA